MITGGRAKKRIDLEFNKTFNHFKLNDSFAGMGERLALNRQLDEILHRRLCEMRQLISAGN